MKKSASSHIKLLSDNRWNMLPPCGPHTPSTTYIRLRWYSVERLDGLNIIIPPTTVWPTCRLVLDGVHYKTGVQIQGWWCFTKYITSMSLFHCHPTSSPPQDWPDTCTRTHSASYIPPPTTINSLFFPNAVVLWNSLPCNIAMLSDADAFRQAVGKLGHP